MIVTRSVARELVQRAGRVLLIGELAPEKQLNNLPPTRGLPGRPGARAEASGSTRSRPRRRARPRPQWDKGGSNPAPHGVTLQGAEGDGKPGRPVAGGRKPVPFSASPRRRNSMADTPRMCAAPNCGRALQPGAATQRKYCSQRCQKAVYRAKKTDPTPVVLPVPVERGQGT